MLEDVTQSKRDDIASLTGLRGLAAVFVVITHYWLWSRVTSLDALPESVERWTRTAGIGMAIFFTLSGYVIALSYSGWDWRERPAFNLVRLFFYRFARLYPAFFVFALLVILRFPALQDFSDSAAQGYLWPHLLLWQTWLPLKFDGELPAADHFHVSWSLSVECALYLMFGVGAVLAAALPRWRYKTLALCGLFFVSMWWFVDFIWSMRQDLMPIDWREIDWLQWLLYYSPYAISRQFIIGVATYRLSCLSFSPLLLRTASHLGALGLIAIYLLNVCSALRDPFTTPLYVALATALLMLGSTTDTITNRLLSTRPILYLGTISYSLYLFHFMTPPLALHSRHFDSFTSMAALFHAINFVASFALAIVVATGVYRLVEVPGRRAIRAVADRLLGLRSVGTAAAPQSAPAE